MQSCHQVKIHLPRAAGFFPAVQPPNSIPVRAASAPRQNKGQCRRSRGLLPRLCGEGCSSRPCRFSNKDSILDILQQIDPLGKIMEGLTAQQQQQHFDPSAEAAAAQHGHGNPPVQIATEELPVPGPAEAHGTPAFTSAAAGSGADPYQGFKRSVDSTSDGSAEPPEHDAKRPRALDNGSSDNQTNSVSQIASPNSHAEEQQNMEIAADVQADAAGPGGGEAGPGKQHHHKHGHKHSKKVSRKEQVNSQTCILLKRFSKSRFAWDTPPQQEWAKAWP